MERRPDSAPDPRRRPNQIRLLLQVHIIWCPKFRRPVLVDGVDERFKEILSEVAAEARSEVVEMEVMPDHVQLRVEVDPRFGTRRSVKLARERSSRPLRQDFPRLRSRIPTLGTNSYAVLTVGGALLAVIKQSIEDKDECDLWPSNARSVAPGCGRRRHKVMPLTAWPVLTVGSGTGPCVAGKATTPRRGSRARWHNSRRR